RIRGVTSQGAPAQSQSAQPERARNTQTKPLPRNVQPPEETNEQPGPDLPDDPLEPRCTAPEVNFNAMRQLANANARAAIDHHSRRSKRQETYNKAIVSLVAIVCAGVLLFSADRVH